MNKRAIILQGSSHSFGNTHRIVTEVKDQTGIEIIDLKTKEIGQFDYEFKNRDDDFLPLIREIVDNYDLIIFATPVYWYSMSGIMKKFFDRISDCLKIEKETGRKLRGKSMAVISCGYDEEIKDGYFMPFVESAKYLGMSYLGEVHTWIQDGTISPEVRNRIDLFIQQLQE